MICGSTKKTYKCNYSLAKRFVVEFKRDIGNRKAVTKEILCHSKIGSGLIFIDYWIWFVRRKIVSYLQKRIISIINLNRRKLTIGDLNWLMWIHSFWNMGWQIRRMMLYYILIYPRAQQDKTQKSVLGLALLIP